MRVLGIDTSNYTTSVAAVDGGGYRQAREILDVKEGERGLRQSDALFLHTKNLPRLIEELGAGEVDAVAYSSRPRAVLGSYMPCFLAGGSVARSIAATLGVPVFAFSHQAGHIEAAVRSCGADVGIEFLAFHLSGGTTEILLARADEKEGWLCDIIGKTLDLSAGQVIDRAGVLLGLKFPCGNELEKLAAACDEKITDAHPSVKDGSCNLSGAENKIQSLIASGATREYVARYAIELVGKTVVRMTAAAREKYRALPVVFAGGVMRNEMIRKMLAKKFENIFFAKTELSSDNAVGTAYLGMKAMGGKL